MLTPIDIGLYIIWGARFGDSGIGLTLALTLSGFIIKALLELDRARLHFLSLMRASARFPNILPAPPRVKTSKN